ncbi:hypothetical protein [Leptospira interrogans]|uniref:HEPN domain-containing protein n=1 Tax=Leptospira interrogans serovar Zanoni str. LT2156 TaxID=1001601 RepID=M6HK41_LEPIR|nr:hypothetical protein [Leptospira interrogans]EMM97703.1 hypothetical protein LEP1GSC158_3414 [Leptospira interrogans serovar Zanoni str. LT2156]KAA1292614.1 hypothetical protein C4X99_04840 [Leptospira interrogans serovar Geyaweera]KAA1292655.1 hypothetical protein C4X99_05110 [Leptospira interrogans serovar Geyaweera]
MEERSKKIFNTALQYRDSAILLNSSGNLRVLIPSQVIGALAIELYFKSIYYIENEVDFKINDRYSHDFYKLLKNLSFETQSLLRSDFSGLMKKRNNSDILQYESFLKVKIK